MTEGYELKTPLRVLLMKSENGWVAQCLEYDVASQGPTRWTAMESVASTVGLQIAAAQKEGVSLSEIPTAPAEYFRMWELASEAPTLRERFQQWRRAPKVEGIPHLSMRFA